MDEKLQGLKKATEELILNHQLMAATLSKLWQAIVVDQYRKANPELKHATIIRYRVSGENLDTIIITNDDAEIRKFSNIIEGYIFHPKRKEFPNLQVNRLVFKNEKEPSTYISSISRCFPS